MKVKIIEFVAPNNYTINAIVLHGTRDEAKKRAGLLISYYDSNLYKDILHAGKITVEDWEISTERYTYAASKQYMICYIQNNQKYKIDILANGVKTAYLNFRKKYKQMGAEFIEPVIIIEMNQQLKTTGPVRPNNQHLGTPGGTTPRAPGGSGASARPEAPAQPISNNQKAQVNQEPPAPAAPPAPTPANPVKTTPERRQPPSEVDIYSAVADKIGLENLENLDDDSFIEKLAERDSKIQAEAEKIQKKLEEHTTEKILQQETKDSTVDPSVVKKTVNTIMAVYDAIYQPLFQSAPLGILTSNGIITVKKDNSLYRIENGSDYAVSLYNAIYQNYKDCIKELDYHEEVSFKRCINTNGDLVYNYIPNWHIRNIFGIYRGKDGNLKREKAWSKFRPILVRSLTATITNILEKFNGNRLQLSIKLVELFTTVFIAEDFDVNKSIKLTAKSVSISQKFNDCSGIGQIIAAGSALSIDPSTIKLIDNSEISNGIQSILAVFDEKTYNGEILFAYKPLQKILESGGQVGLQNLLLGRDIRGNNVTINFQSPQLIDTVIIAGSGSGKGVVTLNMLATFIASGCPTVYVDWKPDMAAMLWDLERETGAKILAIDGLDGRTEDTLPVRNYGVGFNMPDVPYKNLLHTIPYLKAFQCMVLCAQARNQGYAGLSYKQPKMMFIFDEAQKMNTEYRSLRGALDEYLNNRDIKAENKTDKTPGFLYTKRLKRMLGDLYNGATEVKNTTGRTGNIGFVMLGQQADVASWADGALKKGEPFGFLVGNCSMKLLGREAIDDNKYSMNGAKPVGRALTDNKGYFAVINGSVADKTAPEKIKVVKTYLALNKNDYADDGAGGSTGRFTGGMLSNVTDSTLKEQLINEDFYPMDDQGQRYINPKVGFKGLVEYIGSTSPGFDLNKNLSAGYNAVDAVLSELGITGPNGRYSCVEEYLFDCSINSLFSLGDLQDLIRNHQTIKDISSSEGQGGPGSSGGQGGFDDDIPDGVIGVYDEADTPTPQQNTSSSNTSICNEAENNSGQPQPQSQFEDNVDNQYTQSVSTPI